MASTTVCSSSRTSSVSYPASRRGMSNRNSKTLRLASSTALSLTHPSTFFQPLSPLQTTRSPKTPRRRGASRRASGPCTSLSLALLPVPMPVLLPVLVPLPAPILHLHYPSRGRTPGVQRRSLDSTGSQRRRCRDLQRPPRPPTGSSILTTHGRDQTHSPRSRTRSTRPSSVPPPARATTPICPSWVPQTHPTRAPSPPCGPSPPLRSPTLASSSIPSSGAPLPHLAILPSRTRDTASHIPVALAPSCLPLLHSSFIPCSAPAPVPIRISI